MGQNLSNWNNYWNLFLIGGIDKAVLVDMGKNFIKIGMSDVVNQVFSIKQMVVSAVHTNNNNDVSDSMFCNQNLIVLASFYNPSATCMLVLSIWCDFYSDPSIINIWLYMKNVKGHMPPF